MYHYSIIQWIFFFYFYCFFGWVFESTYVSIKSKKFVNRGFMHGPFLPIYGSGAIMMLVVSMPFQNNLILTYLAGCVGATVLEFVTGMLMESLFKVRYWDYSNQPFNYKGHICLSSTVAWGFLTIFMTGFLHKVVERVVFAIPGNVVTVITLVLSVYIVADFTLAFKAALDLRDILIGLDKAKEEMERIQKRLDVLVAVANDEYETWKKNKPTLSNYSEAIANNLEDKFSFIKEKLVKEPGSFVESVREELVELRSKYMIEKEHRVQFHGLKNFYQRSMIKGNPGMVSAKFGDALEELKKAVNEKIPRKHNDFAEK